MSDVKVSIIIPVYNPGKLLIDCLDSTINQTLDDIEIICVDDGSSDGSDEILKEYAKKDKRVKVFTQKNFGAGFARNLGIENANGKYIAFLDSDDWIEQDMCEKLYNHAENLKTDLILFDTIRHLENNRKMDMVHFEDDEIDWQNFTFDYHFIKDKVMNGYFGVIWSKFYRTAFIKDNNILFTEHKMFNDVEYHIKSLLLAKSIGYYPEVFYHYVMIGQPSLQKTYVGTHDSLCFYDVMCGVRDFLGDYKFMDEFREEFLNYSFFYFKRKLKYTDERYQEEYFSKIKKYFKSLNITPEEFREIENRHIPFYIHIINSKSHIEFKVMHDRFDGEKVKIRDENIENSLNYEWDEIESNKVYSSILEGDYADFYDNILDLHDNLEDLKREMVSLKMTNDRLNDENLHFRRLNQDLNSECERLQSELDEIKSTKLWKLKSKF